MVLLYCTWILLRAVACVLVCVYVYIYIVVVVVVVAVAVLVGCISVRHVVIVNSTLAFVLVSRFRF
jgi:hypothetical protein